MKKQKSAPQQSKPTETKTKDQVTMTLGEVISGRTQKHLTPYLRMDAETKVTITIG